MSLQIFRTKHVVTHDGHDHGLKRCLSAWDLAFLGVGAIIGTGIFVLTGIAAATQSGPAIVLSFVIAGLACAFAALSYAELSAAVGGCGFFLQTGGQRNTVCRVRESAVLGEILLKT